jgi:hypothetical protein
MLIALGVRLAVGQQTLDLLAEVRILHPQPASSWKAKQPDTPPAVLLLCRWYNLFIAIVREDTNKME